MRGSPAVNHPAMLPPTLELQRHVVLSTAHTTLNTHRSYHDEVPRRGHLRRRQIEQGLRRVAEGAMGWRETAPYSSYMPVGKADGAALYKRGCDHELGALGAMDGWCNEHGIECANQRRDEGDHANRHPFVGNVDPIGQECERAREGGGPQQGPFSERVCGETDDRDEVNTHVLYQDGMAHQHEASDSIHCIPLPRDHADDGNGAQFPQVRSLSRDNTVSTTKTRYF
ncbi:hypothetical protein PC9H_008279 [Pleurotus ostreatus]|uniref:Uncharacterized protein n=1 Tax=Pleurotus ostreatus TaxID=5322 RepID=A0A8H6ZQT0_PLEOS|nr:uncharacterized protein PC9H_008279 [Pleurotus ostreatus]KAF7425917.1 hypothetical protein PC9H_008279 [Pleurotus ostreatus]